MLTPELERLILKGKAEYIQFNVGVGGVTTITVPEKCYIVITDIIWTPFLDVEFFSSEESQVLFEQRAVKQLQLRSLNKNVNWIFRDSMLIVQDATGDNRSVKLDPPTQYHCFHKFTEDVRVDIVVLPGTFNWTVDSFAVMPDGSGEEEQPNGYGTVTGGGVSTVQKVTLNPGGTAYYPPGFSRLGLQPAGRDTDQFHTDYQPGFELQNPVTLGTNQSYPIITFGYVQITQVSEN